MPRDLYPSTMPPVTPAGAAALVARELPGFREMSVRVCPWWPYTVPGYVPPGSHHAIHEHVRGGPNGALIVRDEATAAAIREIA